MAECSSKKPTPAVRSGGGREFFPDSLIPLWRLGVCYAYYHKYYYAYRRSVYSGENLGSKRTVLHSDSDPVFVNVMKDVEERQFLAAKVPQHQLRYIISSLKWKVKSEFSISKSWGNSCPQITQITQITQEILPEESESDKSDLSDKMLH